MDTKRRATYNNLEDYVFEETYILCLCIFYFLLENFGEMTL